MQFRTAATTDADAIRTLAMGVRAEYGILPDPKHGDRDLEDMEGNYVEGGGRLEVLVDESGRIVGCYGLSPLGDGVCELRKMYLLSEYRGRGLGKAMLERALEHARAHGFRRVQLETANVLREAIGLYRAYGFQPCTLGHMSSRCDCAMYLDL